MVSNILEKGKIFKLCKIVENVKELTIVRICTLNY